MFVDPSLAAADRGAAGPVTTWDYRGVRVLTVSGVLWQGAAAEVASAARAAAQDPAVRRVVLEINSPGGAVAGMAEACAAVRAMAAAKPTTAYVRDTAASGGYMLAAQCPRVVATATAVLGSIGAVAMVADTSEAWQKAGVRWHVVARPEGKGLLWAPEVGEQAKERMGEVVGQALGVFLEQVAPRLGAEKALATDARVYMGRAAVDAGLADEIDHDFTGFVARQAKEAAMASKTELMAAGLSEADAGAMAGLPAGAAAAVVAARENAGAASGRLAEIDAALAAVGAKVEALAGLAADLGSRLDALLKAGGARPIGAAAEPVKEGLRKDMAWDQAVRAFESQGMNKVRAMIAAGKAGYRHGR